MKVLCYFSAFKATFKILYIKNPHYLLLDAKMWLIFLRNVNRNENEHQKKQIDIYNDKTNRNIGMLFKKGEKISWKF